ncbi:MAG: Gfo/Idh/MocA family oxidoreductase [Planctomycetes bacterium]|nr:Gfo/Idh/MocA family oxidoreductase [Planctomycetota bacterium]
MSLRVAVVGVGHLGRHHARIYASMPDVTLAGVVDTASGRAEEVGREHRAAAFTDYREILGKVDAVSIAVPTVGHFAVAKEFLERGIPVLVEKPLAKTIEEAEELVRIARRHRAPLAVGHVERFNPAVMAARKMIERPRFIEVHRLSPFRFRSTDIDVVHDLMIHDIDIILHFVASELKRIDAVGVSLLFGSEDIANARLEFEDGCVANVTASRVSDKQMRKIRMFSTNGYVSIDTLEKAARLYRTTPQFAEALAKLPKDRELSLGDLAAIPREFYSIEEVRLPDEEPLAAELRSFVDSVRAGREPEVPGEHGVRAMKAAERILREIREHVWK